MKLRKTMIALTLSLVVLGNCMSAFAMEAASPVLPTALEDEGIEPRTEETVWYTRFHEGRWQKRLWSITYERWLTEWIDVGTGN